MMFYWSCFDAGVLMPGTFCHRLRENPHTFNLLRGFLVLLKNAQQMSVSYLWDQISGLGLGLGCLSNTSLNNKTQWFYILIEWLKLSNQSLEWSIITAAFSTPNLVVFNFFSLQFSLTLILIKTFLIVFTFTHMCIHCLGHLHLSPPPCLFCIRITSWVCVK
jgi:hypothetical protein